MALVGGFEDVFKVDLEPQTLNPLGLNRVGQV